MKHLLAALMVVLALAAPAAPDTREGSLDGQAAIEIGPFRIAVSREEDKETLRLNDLVVGRARAVSLIYLARMRSATVVAFHENEMVGGCEAPPSFLVLYSNGSHIVDRSVNLGCRESDIDRAGERLKITPFRQRPHFWSPPPMVRTSPNTAR